MIEIYNYAGQYVMPSYREELEVDGTIVPEHGENIILPGRPAEILEVNRINKIVSYGDMEPGEFEEYIYEKWKMGDMWDVEHLNRDDRNEVENFLMSHVPVTRTVIEKRRMDFTIIELCSEPVNDCIMPLRVVGQVAADGVELFKYSPDAEYIVKQIFEELGVECKYELSYAHSLEFFKIDGEYVHSDYRLYGIGLGTRDECVARYEKHYEDIKAIIKLHLAKHSKDEIEDVGSVVGSLVSILETLKEVEPYRRNRAAYNNAMSGLNGLIGRLSGSE